MAEDVDGICGGLRVVDITRGIAGPITTMLLADHGADVVRIEPPGGDNLVDLPGSAVWNRGKRLVHLDLTDAGDRGRLLDLTDRADVLVESFRPGVTERLGINHRTLAARNSRLVYTSITGYGRGTPDADRPGIEWLVTARTGMQWDQRGYFGTRTDHVMGSEASESTFAVPPGAEQTGCREGPIFLAVPWASLGAALLASAATNAALFARGRTGKGQLVETSLLQAVLMENAMGWQRVDEVHPSYRLWYFDRRAPKGLFRTLDGGWLHQWAPFEHEFIRSQADPEHLRGTLPPVGVPAGGYESHVRHEVDEYSPSADAIATRRLDDWVDRFARAGVPAQPVRSPEAALFDDALERDGVVVEVDDPQHGRIRQVGHIVGFDEVPNPPIRARAARPDMVEDIAGRWRSGPAHPPTVGGPTTSAAPLHGIVVLDFGLAIAGPYGPQILADLGATVIKVTSLGFSLTDAIYVGSSQGKRALAVDLKDPRGREISHRLIERADVVHHNMRPGVAERLGIDYATACRLNSKIIYCHTRGFERDGPRSHLPGNDQMGNALAGTEYEGGGTHHGTPPIWHATAFGDTANGVASANAVIQALAHRDRTGRGQFVHTSILNVCMLFNSSTFARPDGSAPQRARIDADQFGFSALRRLYETASGWLCLYLRHENDWMSLCAAIDLPELVVNDRFGSGSERASNDAELVAVLSRTFAKRSADEWFSRLDTAGVPCEISSPTFAREALADPALRERGWVIANPHPHLGHVEQVGMPFSFSESSAQNLAGAPITGQHSREILTELGYTDEEIDALIDTSVVLDGSSEVIAP